MVRVLFVHQNFPAQYRHVAKVLAAAGQHQVVALGEAANLRRLEAVHPAIQRIGYSLAGQQLTTKNPWLKNVEAAVVRGQVVANVARELKAKGFVPDVIAGHPGWGETLFLRDVFPTAGIISYCEFYYQGVGADVGFDPEFPGQAEDAPLLRTRNLTHLSAIESADVGVSPSQWQRSLYPALMQSKIQVVHEGIDSTQV